MTRLLRLVGILIACCAFTARAQNTVFNAALSGDVLNPSTYPAVTSSTTGWDVLSNKNAPAPTESGGTLTINMAATTSGYIEAQALFAPAPVQLLPGTYIELTTTFVPTFVLTNSADNLIFGLFNSGGSAPLAGLLNSGLNNTLTTFATGGAKGWIGYNANIPLTGASPKMLNRAAQTATNNTVQDVLVDSQSTSVGYSVPASTSASSVGAMSTTLTNGSTYTLDYKLSLSADGLALTAGVSLYNGAGVTGVGANTLISSYTGKFTGTAMLTKVFDALAIGWRADAGASGPSSLKLIALTLNTTGGAPWVTTQPPANIAVSIGSDLNLSSVVGGTVNSYQWQVSTDGGNTFTNIDSIAIPSAATPSLTLTNIQYANAGSYRLIATNSAGSSASSACVVTVSATPVAPTISTNPVGATVQGGTPYTFNVTVNGTSPLTYQWEKSTDGATFTPVVGATSAAYTISSASLSDEGYFRVTVSNVAGSATSAAAQLIVNQPLTITNQPVGAALNLGASYSLSVTAVGKPAPTYQWFLNGNAISGATASTYSIASAAAANVGIYTVVASNTSGDSVTSSGAAIAVLSPTLATTTLTPVPTPTGIAPDTRLTLTFNQPISVGVMGTIKIYDASNPTTPVDTIDLISGNSLMKTLRTTNSISTLQLPVQNKTVGGLTNFNYYPITVLGNTATLYPRNNVITYGKSYFVTIDPGVFTDSSGLSFGGFSDSASWTFSTKTASPSSGATQLVVAADGSGDFYTVQAALDFIPAGNTAPRTIFIRKGTYFEEVYFTGKHSITFLGEDRTQSVVVYPNNANFNGGSGAYHRMTLYPDHVNSVTFLNLTIQNSTAKGGAQAEALILNGSSTAQAIISNVELFSYQDTLQISGQAYVTDSHISGDVDFMWGGGPCFFNNCELTALTSGGYYTQIRNGSATHGYVYSNCTLDAASGVSGMYLSRIDPSASTGFPFSEVVWLNCIMGTFDGSTYATPVKAAGWLLNNTPDQTAASAPNIHFWEYNSHYTDNTPIDVSQRIGASKQLTTANDSATIANYSTPSYVLGSNWTPTSAPVIAASPTAQTVNSGGGFTLSVQAFGIPALTYQWLRNGVPIAAATGASYTVATSTANDAGMYSVVVSNGASSVTTTGVPLIVHGAPPVIALQPADTSGLLGATATLNAWALGDGPFTYQWMKNGSPIPGATNLALRLTGIQSSDAGSYSVGISNANGTTMSDSATLTTVTPAMTLPTVPQIPVGIFDVTTYGAVGDGVTDNTAAIQAAINAAKTAGGGTIELPPASGAYLCGPITVSSFMNFQVDAGATLRALPYGVYPNTNTAPANFINVVSNASNIEFSGGGTIDGDGAAWWAAYAVIGPNTPRFRLVQISTVTNILFAGTTFSNSPTFHLAFRGASVNVTIFGVTISAPGDSPNTDGMDICGTNILVQHCSVSDGDDNIVAKPGGTFCRNLYIADCSIGAGHGVSIGGQSNVGLDGMTVTNCTFNGTSSALRFKADPTEGGPVQNVAFSNLTMKNVQYPILFYSYYNELGSPGAVSGSSQTTPAKVNAWNVSPPNSLASSTIPVWKNITITNLTVINGSGYSTIWGLPTADGLIQNVTLNNVNIQGGAGLELFDAANIQLTGTNGVGPIITCNALAITSQPIDKTVNVGDSVTFSATAVGGSGTNNTGLTYQWKLNGTSVSDGLQADGSTISGATTSTLTTTNVRATRAGNYAVTVSTNLDGYNVAASSLVANSLPVNAMSSAALLTVNSIPASVSLGSLLQTYDGTPHAVSVTTSPSNLPVTVLYGSSPTPPTNAGSYAVVATIADPNYVGGDSEILVINPATPNISVAAYSVPYDGQSHSAIGSVTGVVGEALAGLDLGQTVHTTAGAYTDGWSFTDGTGNYTSAIGTVMDVIAKVNPVITVRPYTTLYDGVAHSAMGSAAGVGGEPLAGLDTSGTTHTNAGTYTDTWTFVDSTGNYSNTSGFVADSITRAAAAITLAPLVQRYDGTPKPVTATTSPLGLAVTLTYDGVSTAPIYPGPHAVVAAIDDANYTGTKSDTLNVGITALVRHAPTINGILDGSVQMLSGEWTTFNSNASVSGDLLVPGTPTIQRNGNPTLVGTKDATGSVTPSGYGVTLNSGAVLRYLVRRVDPIALPTVAAPLAPTGTRSVSLNNPSDNAGDFATLRNLTLNSNAGRVIVPAGAYGSFTVNGSSHLVLGVVGATEPAMYSLQGLTLNGNAVIEVLGSVTLTVANSVNLNGVFGEPTHPEWLTLQVYNGGVTLNSNAALHGSAIAPSGTVTLNGNSAIRGSVAADRLTLNGNALLDDTP